MLKDDKNSHICTLIKHTRRNFSINILLLLYSNVIILILRGIIFTKQERLKILLIISHVLREISLRGKEPIVLKRLSHKLHVFEMLRKIHTHMRARARSLNYIITVSVDVSARTGCVRQGIFLLLRYIIFSEY